VKEPIRITEAEWEVMAVAWERAPVAASTVLEEAGTLVEARHEPAPYMRCHVTVAPRAFV